MKKTDFIYLIIASAALIAALIFYLPRKTKVGKIKAEINREKIKIRELSFRLPRKSLAKPDINELLKAKNRLLEQLPEEWDVAGATEEIVNRSKRAGTIDIESITEVGPAEPSPEGVEKWLIQISLKASYHDFARFLYQLGEASIPLAVESFTILNPDNSEPLSMIDLTLAVCRRSRS